MPDELGRGRPANPTKEILGALHYRCGICEEYKPRSEFYTDHQRDGRVKYPCKVCLNERVRAWREENREAYNAYARAYQKKWRATHPRRGRGKGAPQEG